AHAMGKSAHTRKNQALRIEHVPRFASETALHSDLLEHVYDGADIAHLEIHNGDHAEPATRCQHMPVMRRTEQDVPRRRAEGSPRTVVCQRLASRTYYARAA